MSGLIRIHLKTTSEWLQTSPAAPVMSKLSGRMLARQCAFGDICNEGGTAYNCYVLRPLQSERLQGIFFCNSIKKEEGK